MKQILFQQGRAVVEEVPSPLLDEHSVLVDVAYSLISSGTESSGIAQSRESLFKKAVRQPQKVQQVIRKLGEEGLAKTWQAVRGQLAVGNPAGYSCAGTVVAAKTDGGEFQPGMAVACAGAGKANHAEVVAVPKNLVVPVPAGCPIKSAASVALGAISMQAVRRARVSLGETVAVMGLGLVGQLIVQMLKLSGARVIGFDPLADRVGLALDSGAHAAHLTDSEDELLRQVKGFTGGQGTDATLISAASSSSQLVNQAMQITRRKGRVVVVGDVGLALNRSPFYEKEIDFLISCSYGPGRYDPSYEELGRDYPLPYVRWTEKRNMEEYLQLLSEAKIDFDKLVGREFEISKAPAAYEALRSATPRPLAILIRYPSSGGKAVEDRLVRVTPTPRSGSNAKVNLALAGAGEFAKGTHLPNIQSLSRHLQLRSIFSRTGTNAVATAKRYGAHQATTDYQQILSDPEVDAVLIATRHHLHAEMALQALQAGKHVLVEKPLALTKDELQRIVGFYTQTGASSDQPVLLTGFNRRFSPFVKLVAQQTARRSDSMMINYTMNIGHLPQDHWVNSSEGGGRNLGEACHIYDLFTFLTNSQFVELFVQTVVPHRGLQSRRDNFIASLRFEDGSLANLTFTSLGSKLHPKERLEIFVDGQVLVLDDYRSLVRSGTKTKIDESKTVQKGHREELEAFTRSIQSASDWPIPLWQQVQAMEIAFQVEERLRGNR